MSGLHSLLGDDDQAVCLDSPDHPFNDDHDVHSALLCPEAVHSAKGTNHKTR